MTEPYGEHATAFFGHARRLGFSDGDVMQSIYNALMAGDPEVAIEAFATLERIINRSVAPPTHGAGKANETRESQALTLETATEERSLAMAQYRELRSNYENAMAELEAMKAQMAEQQAEIAEALAAAKSAKADAADPIDPAALEEAVAVPELSSGQSRRERRDALMTLTEPMPANDAMADFAEELAAQFAADPDSPGYLTRTQVSQLIAAVLAVPQVRESEHGHPMADVQASPMLVDAVIRGFEEAAPESVELMSAQLGQAGGWGVNSSYKEGTLPGHGRDAITPLRRSSDPDGIYPHMEFELADPRAAPVTHQDASGRALYADGTSHERLGEATVDYNPGDVLEHSIRIQPGEDADFPMTFSGSAYFSSYTAEAGVAERRGESMNYRYTLDRAEDGTILVSRQEVDGPRYGPPIELDPIVPEADGSFVISHQEQPMSNLDNIDEGVQRFTIRIGTTRRVFVHEKS